MEIGFVGLGKMGGNMVKRLLTLGSHKVVVSDRGAEAVAASVSAGATGATDLADLVKKLSAPRTVWVMVPSGGPTQGVIDQLATLLSPGDLVVDGGNSNFNDSKRRGAQLKEKGIFFMDAGTSGGIWGLTVGYCLMVGGEDEAVERARPVLDPLAGKIIHCGSAGAGQAAKVCNNMVLAVQQIAVGEAFVLAEKLGLSAQSLFDVITGATGNCWAVHTNCPVPGPVPTSPANNDFQPGFATALMNKDLGLAMDAVNSTGSTAPLGSHAAEIYAKFAVDHAGLDFSAVIEMLRAG